MVVWRRIRHRDTNVLHGDGEWSVPQLPSHSFISRVGPIDLHSFHPLTHATQRVVSHYPIYLQMAQSQDR